MVQPESLSQGFTLIVEDKAKKAAVSSPIFVAGSFNNWNPGDPRYQLEPQSDMRWRINLPQPKDGAPIEFKFTRGTWALEELRDDMSPPPNRTLTPVDVSKLKDGESPRIELSVAHWGDERPEALRAGVVDEYTPVKVTGTVKRLQVQGGAGAARGAVRDLLVWLPGEYDDPRQRGRTFPVLYLHDGQNIFSKLPGVPGEWRADETATELIQAGRMVPIVIVGIPHSGPTRIAEYMPVKDGPIRDAEGMRHLEWLTSEVMPRVERAFRVKTGREHTAIGGASMGSIISIGGVAAYADRFGLLLAESTPVMKGDEGAWDSMLAKMKTPPLRVFIGIGGSEVSEKAQSERLLAWSQELAKRFAAAGTLPSGLKVVMEPTATHSEQAWAERLPQALQFLFPAR
jgi:predicted alpha/beta superfamily hydrolase